MSEFEEQDIEVCEIEVYEVEDRSFLSGIDDEIVCMLDDIDNGILELLDNI